MASAETSSRRLRWAEASMGNLPSLPQRASAQFRLSLLPEAATAKNATAPATTGAARSAGSEAKSGVKPAEGTRQPSSPIRQLRIKVASSSVGYVFVRQAADPKAAIVGKVRPGEIHDVTEVVNGWYHLESSGGWIAGKYVIVQ
jgi:hypothetical protein